jgi:hypothetical protein
MDDGISGVGTTRTPNPAGEVLRAFDGVDFDRRLNDLDAVIDRRLEEARAALDEVAKLRHLFEMVLCG